MIELYRKYLGKTFRWTFGTPGSILFNGNDIVKECFRLQYLLEFFILKARLDRSHCGLIILASEINISVEGKNSLDDE